MRISVRQRVTLTVLLSALLPLLAVWAITLGLSYVMQHDAAQSQQETVAKLVANDFSQFIRESERQLRIFANSLAEASEPETISEQELRGLITGTSFSEVSFYNPSGERQAGLTRFGPPQQPLSIAQSPILAQIELNRPFFGSPSRIEAASLPLSPDEVPRLRIAVPVQLAFDTRWVLMGDVNMDQIWARTTSQETSTQTRIFVLDEQGALISSSQIQQLIDGLDLANSPLLATDAASADYTSPVGGEVLGTKATIEPLGWTLIVERPQEEIYADLEQLALNLFLVILAAFPAVFAIGWFAGKRIVRPIQDLHDGVATFTKNPDDYRPLSIGNGDELTALGSTFNTMVAAINESRTRLAAANAELEDLVGTRTAELQTALVEVQSQQKTQQELLETVRRLTMPVIPIRRGMVVMPIVGDITATRSADITAQLLQAIEAQNVRVVLIDITGLVSADEFAARSLIDAAAAARLLGAKVILAGIRPDLAESLINVNVNFKDLHTAATLEQAFTLGSSLIR